MGKGPSDVGIKLVKYRIIAKYHNHNIAYKKHLLRDVAINKIITIRGIYLDVFIMPVYLSINICQMEYLEINAEIYQHKLNEFNQSKLTFIEGIQKMDGYVEFLEKPGKQFNMKIGWNNHKSLLNFMMTEQYKYFRGAIITLSDSNSINIIKKTKEYQK